MLTSVMRIGHALSDTDTDRRLKSAFALALIALTLIALDFLILRERTPLERSLDAWLLAVVLGALVALHATKRCDVAFHVVLSLGIPAIAALLLLSGNREGDLFFFTVAPVAAIPLLGPRRSLPWLLICIVTVAAIVLIDPLLPPLSSAWHASRANPSGMLFHSPTRPEISFDQLTTFVVATSFLYGLTFSAYRALHRANRRIEDLLFNVLPPSVVARLADQHIKANREPGAIVSDECNQASILFADIVGFTELSGRMPSARLLKILDDVFTEFDHIAERHGVEKIKTIGDAYMAVSGLPEPDERHAENIADMALEMIAAIERYRRITGVPLRIRIGINTGPVIAGIIGRKKFIYDLWGDAVNTASRMESHGEPDTIQVSDGTHEVLRDRYVFKSRGTIAVKGKGPINAWRLVARKA